MPYPSAGTCTHVVHVVSHGRCELLEGLAVPSRNASTTNRPLVRASDPPGGAGGLASTSGYESPQELRLPSGRSHICPGGTPAGHDEQQTTAAVPDAHTPLKHA